MVQPKYELLVFSKREVFIVIVLLVLVGMLSFTIGLRMGKNLGITISKDALTEQVLEHMPLSEKDTGDSHASGAAHKEEAATTDTHKSDLSVADAKLAEEMKKEKLTPVRPIETTLPKDKKAELKPASSYFTLQVGAYKTVAEASERVAQLKRDDLANAFYFEAEVPGKGTWYRVGLGTYATKNEAENAGKELKVNKASQAPAFIVQRIGE